MQVPISTLLTFKRLKALTEDAKVIVDALEKSSEGLVEISEDKEKLRRHKERPLPEFNEETRKELMSRTAYAKGFPLDSQMNDLIEFFKDFENIENIVMRKYYDQKEKNYKFKGSVFVSFTNKEKCEEFVKKAKIECKGVGLIRKMQEDYAEMKKRERTKQDKKKAKKAQREEDDGKDEGDTNQFYLPPATCLLFSGITDEKILFHDIKDAVKSVDANREVAFVDFTPGSKEGKIRFLVENDAPVFFQMLTDGKLKIKNDEVTCTLLEGDDEKEYLKQSAKNIRMRIKDMKNNRHNKRHNKGGGRRNGKHRGDQDDDDFQSKKSRTEEDNSSPQKQKGDEDGEPKPKRAKPSDDTETTKPAEATAE